MNDLMATWYYTTLIVFSLVFLAIVVLGTIEISNVLKNKKQIKTKK